MSSNLRLTPMESREVMQKTELAAGPRPIVSPNGRTIQFPVDGSYPLILSDPECAQCFSILRTRLLSVHSKGGIRSVIITSPGPGEGKTLIALNLALSLGQLARTRVLLVDGDLRRKSLSWLLKTENQRGLSDFLRGEQLFDTIVQTTTFPSLGVVTAGTAPDVDLPAILEGPRWAEFLDIAKQQFDLVITDCLPVGAPVADFELMAAPCDALLLAVQIRKTSRKSLAQVVSRTDRTKVLGVLVNNADHMYAYNYMYYGVQKRK